MSRRGPGLATTKSIGGHAFQTPALNIVDAEIAVERGMWVLETDVGKGRRFDLMVDRAIDIGALGSKRRPIGWQSAAGPRYPALDEAAAAFAEGGNT